MSNETKKEAAPEIKAEELVGLTKLEQANKITKTFMYWSIGGGLVPVPLFDIAAIYAAQITMLAKITKVYDVPFSEHKAKNVLLPLLGTIGVTPLGVGLLSSIVKIIPFVGTFAGTISVPAIAGAVTYATGKIFTSHFEAGGTLSNFSPEKAKDDYKKSFEEGKDLAKQGAK